MVWDQGLRPLAREATDLLKVEKRMVSVLWGAVNTETMRFSTFSGPDLPALRGAGRPFEVEVLGALKRGARSWEAVRAWENLGN